MVSVNRLLQLFFGISLLYLSFILLKEETLLYYLKPLLLLPLIIAAIISKFKNKKMLLLALVFSLAGDTLLLFVFKNPVYFIFGLIAFLVAHIFYIILFTKELKIANGKMNFKKPGTVIIVIYLFALLALLVPYLGGLTIPVIIYALVITIMLFIAYSLSFYWPKPSSTFLLTGAVSFIILDSILALNKFYHPFSLASFLIMATYLYAQLALVHSCVLKGQ